MAENEILQPVKDSVDAIEKAAVRPPDQLPLPDGLKNLDVNGLAKLESRLVRRLDSTLLPVVVLLFIMNIL